MANTGAPWNIPYVEPTDLVRDYPAADEAMAEAVAAGLTAAGNPGIGSNVQFATDVAGFSTASTTFTTTSLSVVITPSSATSKVLVLAGTAALRSNTANTRTLLAVDRGGSLLAARSVGTSATANARVPATLLQLDSPASASAVTYTLFASTDAGTTEVEPPFFLLAIEVKA